MPIQIEPPNRPRFKCLVYGEPGTGKCLQFGTPVLMFDGSIKVVEEINPNDLLMGPDSKPRRVLGTSHGYGKLYKVTPVKGNPYVVNSEHILSVRRYGEDQPVNISVKEWVDSQVTFKARSKGWRTGVNFPAEFRPSEILPPYLLGLWLGDGSTDSPAICSADPEIEEYVKTYCAAHGFWFEKSRTERRAAMLRIIRRGKWEHNRLLDQLRELRLTDEKYIPAIYKCGSRNDRLQLLAGLMDSDGHLADGCFEISSVIPRLADDILFLARSLGFAAYDHPCYKACQTGTVGYYHRILISGDVYVIPTKIARKQRREPRQQIKDVLKTGITVEPIEDGAYAGFELDGDGLFLLGDFTVTHNSSFAATFPKPILVFGFDPINKELPYLYHYDATDCWVPRGRIEYMADNAGVCVFSEKTSSLIAQVEYYHERDIEHPQVRDQFVARLRKFHEEYDQWATVVFDSLTFMDEIFMNNDINKVNIGAKDPRQHYGASASEIKQLMMLRMAQWPMNVIVLAHVDYDKAADGGGVLRYRPAMPGEKIGRKVPAAFTETYFAYTQEVVVGGKKHLEYWLQTQASGMYTARTGIHAPNPSYPSYKALWPRDTSNDGTAEPAGAGKGDQPK